MTYNTIAEKSMMQTQKTRIICISDTHNQTPKLPPGDVLIHAGDLTNQGSYSELRKTISWIESADFEAKIVVAGNHDTTLDEPFFISNGNKWKWPTPQSPEMCRKLLAESSSITYLEHEAAEIYLTSSKGPQTCFKIFGSPYSPGRRGWAFQYADDAAAQRLWSDIEDDNDIIITHTPAHGHCDETNRDEMSGCPILKQALARVRPMLHICGHIHDARGVERIRWSPSSPSPLSEQSTLGCVDCVEKWEDPGAGNKKISLLDLTARSRLRLDNTGRLAHTNLIVPRDLCVGPDQLDQYSYQNTGDRKGTWRRMTSGAIEYRRCRIDKPTSDTVGVQRNETAVINAAILGLRNTGKARTLNKPIVVDIELPVWNRHASHDEEHI